MGKMHGLCTEVYSSPSLDSLKSSLWMPVPAAPSPRTWRILLKLKQLVNHLRMLSPGLLGSMRSGYFSSTMQMMQSSICTNTFHHALMATFSSQVETVTLASMLGVLTQIARSLTLHLMMQDVSCLHLQARQMAIPMRLMCMPQQL